MFPSSTKRVARSGTIITEIPPAALSSQPATANDAAGSPPPPLIAASSILHFRDDFKLSISASDGKFSESNVDLPRLATPNIQRIPFLALLGVLQVARDVHCLVVVKEQEAVSYDAAIYRITKVVLHQIGSFTLPEADKEEPSPVEPVANASPGSSSSSSSWSSTFSSAAGSISNAAGLGLSGIKAVGSTLKSSIGAVVPATSESLSDPARVMEAVAELLSSGHFYHSERDLTRTLQVGRHERWDWNRLNKEFAWNHFLTKSLPPSLLPRVLPIIQGHVNYISVDSPVPHRIMLIARRGCRRGGRRYIHRGLDPEGHAANLVEVEQIVTSFTSDSVQRTSFVQTRGSVPLLWTQSGLSPKPDIQIDTSLSSQTRAMRRHFRRLTSSLNMDRIRIINLLESSGREAVLSSVFRDMLANLALDGITYTEFDFHRECAGLQFQNVAKLIDLLDHELESAGCFWVHEDTRRRPLTPDPATSPTSATVEVGVAGLTPVGGQAARQLSSPSETCASVDDGVNVLLNQTLLVRCNCLDSLDRTNVVQTWIARKALDMQMLRMGLELTPRVEKSHAEAWANLGDTLSQCYTGTDALKGDFTRTGKRNMQGAAMDLRKSVERMYKNSIRDWFDQSVMDILLGHRSWLPAEVHTVTREFSAEEALVAAWTAKLASPPSSPTAGPVANPTNVPPGGAVPDTAKAEGSSNATPTSPSPAPLFASVTLVLTSRNILVRPSATESMQPIPLNQIQEMQVVTNTLAEPLSQSHAVQVVLRDPSTPPVFMDLTPLVPPPGKSLPGTATAGSLPASPAPSSPITLPGSPLKHASTAPSATPPSTPPSQRRAGYGGALFKRALSAFAWGGSSSAPAASEFNDAASGSGGTDKNSSNTSLPVTPVKGNDGTKADMNGGNANVPSAVVDLITAVQETALRELNHVIRGI
ncbi:SacI homology domain-domain-containing protein [Catenaria anguillulae PL171]|uniref:SacI homology domain-domain-containing protein n=1 Tax=Catenaria anguillulae PL171 TaxID=765915 RepID=A0A1Y2I0X1_9FUNG|nr:SacI homology domain-domain-containing protein [Catenaria anguillulae PL171]